jgi:hypothetical protein
LAALPLSAWWRGARVHAGGGSAAGLLAAEPATEKSRRLTQFTDAATMRTFDVTPDGKQIVFDRLHEKSDVVSIDLPT